MPVHAILIGSATSPGPMAQLRCVMNAWRKRKYIRSVLVLPNTRALVTQLVEVLAGLTGPVMLCNADTTVITDARFDTWVARWVAATRPVWCTGSRTAPRWGVLCALNTALRELLQSHAGDSFAATIAAIHASGKMTCDSTPLAFVYTVPFWPRQPPACIASTPRLQALMTSLMKPPSPATLVSWDKVLIGVAVFLTMCFLIITLKGLAASS